MSWIQRIRSIFAGIIMLVFSGIILYMPENGYVIVASVFGMMLLLFGLGSLLYFFRMGRYMVGGKILLFRGLILMDLGALTMALTDIPSFYLVLYLLGAHAAAGLVEILRGMEARRLASPVWRRSIVLGCGNILSAAAACWFGLRTGSAEIPLYLYCAGLAYAAMGRIINAFRRTTIVYIP